MQTELKRKVLGATNALVVLGLIVALLALVFGVIAAFREGNYLYATVCIVAMYLLFMGSDLLCRRYLRTR